MKTKALHPGTLRSLCKYPRPWQVISGKWAFLTSALHCSEGRNKEHPRIWDVSASKCKEGGFVPHERPGRAWVSRKQEENAEQRGVGVVKHSTLRVQPCEGGLAFSISLPQITGSPRKLRLQSSLRGGQNNALRATAAALYPTLLLLLQLPEHCHDYNTYVTTNICPKIISGYLSKHSTYLVIAHKYSCP